MRDAVILTFKNRKGSHPCTLCKRHPHPNPEHVFSLRSLPCRGPAGSGTHIPLPGTTRGAQAHPGVPLAHSVYKSTPGSLLLVSFQLYSQLGSCIPFHAAPCHSMPTLSRELHCCASLPYYWVGNNLSMIKIQHNIWRTDIQTLPTWSEINQVWTTTETEPDCHSQRQAEISYQHTINEINLHGQDHWKNTNNIKGQEIMSTTKTTTLVQ